MSNLFKSKPCQPKPPKEIVKLSFEMDISHEITSVKEIYDGLLKRVRNTGYQGEVTASDIIIEHDQDYDINCTAILSVDTKNPNYDAEKEMYYREMKAYPEVLSKYKAKVRAAAKSQMQDLQNTLEQIEGIE